MRNLASIVIIGNVGRDPETHISANGGSMCSFSVAVNTRRKESETTAWYRVALFGHLAEIALEHVKKGQPVCVQGTLEPREYTGRDGTLKTSLEINGRELTLLGAVVTTEGDGDRPAVVTRTPAGRIQPADEPSLDELPF